MARTTVGLQNVMPQIAAVEKIPAASGAVLEARGPPSHVPVEAVAVIKGVIAKAATHGVGGRRLAVRLFGASADVPKQIRHRAESETTVGAYLRRRSHRRLVGAGAAVVVVVVTAGVFVEVIVVVVAGGRFPLVTDFGAVGAGAQFEMIVECSVGRETV